MSGPDFFQTPMGRVFYEHTVPELVRQVTRVADALEALIAAMAKAQLRAEEKQG